MDRKNIAFDACMIVFIFGVIMLAWVSVADAMKTHRQITELNAKLDKIASETDAHAAEVLEIKKTQAEILEQIEKNGSDTDAIKKDVETFKNDIREDVERLEYEIDTLTSPEQESITDQEDEIVETGYVEEQPADGYLIAAAYTENFTNENGTECTATELADPISVIPDKNPVPTGPCLTPAAGVFNFEGHTETYYNLDMSVVVRVAQERGIAGEYHVRSDGAKMLGDYIMVAANYEVHPYGSIVNTSLGTGIVVDTGAFTAWNWNNIDIAVTW